MKTNVKDNWPFERKCLIMDGVEASKTPWYAHCYAYWVVLFIKFIDS